MKNSNSFSILFWTNKAKADTNMLVLTNRHGRHREKTGKSQVF